MRFCRFLVRPRHRFAGILATTLLVAVFVEQITLFTPLLAAGKSTEPTQHNSEPAVISRTETSNTYQNPDGSYTLETSTSRMNYKTNGTWKPIDNRLIPTSEDGYSYRNAANSYSVFAGETAEKGVMFCYQGECLETFLGKADGLSARIQVNDNVISYKDVFPDTDWEIVVRSDGYENSLVAKNANSVAGEYSLFVRAKNNTKISTDSNGRIKVTKEGKPVWQTSDAIAYDSKFVESSVAVAIQKPEFIYSDLEMGRTEGENLYRLSLSVASEFVHSAKTEYPVRIDPSLSVSVLGDTFVSPSTLNPANGTRRAMFIGRYTDYTVSGDPTFHKSRALMNFGTLSLPQGAMVSSAYLSLWHYGTNSSNGPAYISLITSPWDERSIWPGPSHSGDYGSYAFPYYNSNTTALRRDIPIKNLSLVTSLLSANYGIMVRNYTESARGEVVCSKEIPSGPCKSGFQPSFTVNYTLNQPPNPPEFSRPGELWELGPKNNGVYPGVSCSTSGTGQGCNIEFNLRTEDPDNTFPLYTENYLNNGSSSFGFSISQATEGWTSHTQGVTDGRWIWQARTKDIYDMWSSWSVTRSFLVDTTSPSVSNMVSEPEFSPGLQNAIESTLSTDGLYGQVAYQFQLSTQLSFETVVQDSGWVDTNSFVFGNLTNETPYYYRVRSKDGLNNIGLWGTTTRSTQDSAPPAFSQISLEHARISPKNEDSRFDTTTLEYEIDELHFKEAIIEIVSTDGEIVNNFSNTALNGMLVIDGKDKLGNFLPDGFYTVRIAASDFAGNSALDDQTYFAIDNTPAVLNVSRPPHNTWYNHSPALVSGITDADAELTISNSATGQIVAVTTDPLSGIFDEEIEIDNGENLLQFRAKDPVGNISISDISVYREEVPPNILAILPDSLVNSNKPVLSLLLEDDGYTDADGLTYASGINTASISIELKHADGTSIVLVNSGVNIHPELGKIEHTCDNNDKCIYSYVFESALAPDGEYQILAKVSDLAGNSSAAISNFELDSHTLFEVTLPSDGNLFNHSRTVLEGAGEKGASVTISGALDYVEFVIHPEYSNDRVEINNCQTTPDPQHDGIKEVCDWQVNQFQMKPNSSDKAVAANTVEFSLTDTALNSKTIIHNYFVDIFAVTLTIDTDIEYFSPNGDGRQDSIEFLEIHTDGMISEWEIRIFSVQNENFIRIIQGQTNLPSNTFWDGKHAPEDPLLNGEEWVEDGEYQYTLFIRTTDDIEFETAPKSLYAKTVLQDEVVITYPKNNTVTTRGVTNVQGQAPVNTTVRICVDTIGLNALCDFEYLTEVDENGLFSRVVPLVRLEGNAQTEHYIHAIAIDAYGNYTEKSNIVRVVVDSRDPFVFVTAMPAFTGANDSESYQLILDKLDRGEEITKEDLTSLRNVILRSVVTQNTERVTLAYSSYTDTSELPETIKGPSIGYIDQAISDNEYTSGLYEHYYDGLNEVYPCRQAECVWDFIYPIPPVTGGIYEFEFNAKKGEAITNLYASVLIDGTIPAAPIILDINKLANNQSYNTNLFENSYYSNSTQIEIIGAADPNTQIKILDNSNIQLCETETTKIGLFSCQTDLASLYSNIGVPQTVVMITVVATDGTYEVYSLEPVALVIDLVPPETVEMKASSDWLSSGAIASITLQSNEKLNFVYLSTPQGTIHDHILSQENLTSTVSWVTSGLDPEGKYLTQNTLADLAGNTASSNYILYIDNTPPDSSNFQKTHKNLKWGEHNGAYALEDVPALGRLTPNYTIRGAKLYLNGFAEKHSEVNLFVDGKYAQTSPTDSVNCQRVFDDSATKDGTVVKHGEMCEWEFEFQFKEEKGYTFAVNVVDRASNRSLIGQQEIVYYDKTAPSAPEVEPKHIITNKLSTTINLSAEALADIQYQQYSPRENTSTSYVLQNGGNGQITNELQLGTAVDSGDCVRNEGNFRVGVCQDGTYRFDITPIDAAGNRSVNSVVSAERDTVAPARPSVTLGLAGTSITANIAGEPNTTVWTNNKPSNFKLDSQGKLSNALIKLWEPEKTYKFILSLVDQAGNVGQEAEVSITTPATGYGNPAVEGAKNFNPWGRESINISSQKASADVILNRDGSYYFENVQIPKPIVTYIDWDLYSYYFYGYGPYVNMPVTFNVYNAAYTRVYTLGDALDLCSVTTLERLVYVPSYKFQCLKHKMNISSYELSLLLKINPVASGVYGNEVLHEKQYVGNVDAYAMHALLHIYKNDVWQPSPDWPPWRAGGDSNSEGRFKADWPIGLMKHPDQMSISIKLYGKDKYKIYNNGNYVNTLELRFEGLESPRSANHTIPNTTINGVTAVVLDVPYFNQYLEPDNSKHPTDGWKMCGAASSVMVTGYYDGLPYSSQNEHSLKKFIYSNSGQEITSDKCGGGAFDITSSGTCAYSTMDGIQKYLKRSNISTSAIGSPASLQFQNIVNSISAGKPVLMTVGDSTSSGKFGHILTIIGYTSDNRLVVHDSYTDLERYGRQWVEYTTGKHALYTFNSTRWKPKWYIRVQ